MSNTMTIALNNEFLSEAQPILDDAVGHYDDKRTDDLYLVAIHPVAVKVEAAQPDTSWDVTIDVTYGEARIIREEALYLSLIHI